MTEWMQAEKIDLIETVAFQLVQKIFESYAFVEKVRLELKKPWAPVPLPLETCSVTIEREKKRAFIGLGTNMGDKHLQLETALEKIKDRASPLQTSTRIETEPWGGVEQDTFLNQWQKLKPG